MQGNNPFTQEFFKSLNSDTLTTECECFYGQVWPLCLYNRWTGSIVSTKITGPMGAGKGGGLMVQAVM